MVLARRRERLAAMEDELRALHIPAQQPEKTDLCEAPEVQDLTALLDVLVSPGHDLSLARANAIKNELIDRGVGASRIETAGMGGELPIASNDTVEGRARNRRSEIVVTAR